MSTILRSTSERIGAGAELFAPERSYRAANLDAAIETCFRDFSYTRTEITLDRFSLDEDLHVTLDGQRLSMTETAFDNVCDALSIPSRFARDVTRELFTIIVDRLGRLHQQAVILVMRDDVIVGVIDPAKWSRTSKSGRPHFQPVTNVELLSEIRKIWKDRERVTGIVLADAGVAIDVVDPAVTVEPAVGDVVRVGMSITASETGGPAPLARGYTVRLACSNGAVVPAEFGSVRFSTDWRVSHERRLQSFTDAVAGFSVDIDAIRSAYGGIANGELTDHTVWVLHRQVAYVYRRQQRADEIADRVIGIETARRKELVAQVRRRQADGRHNDGELPVLVRSGISAWATHNAITSAARDEPEHRRRVALERVGGDLLQLFDSRRRKEVMID